MKSIVFKTMLFLLIVCVLQSFFNVHMVKASGAVYIRADGSVDPPSAPIQRNGDVYTLTDNIMSDTNGIVIQRSNVVLDGAGYTVEGKSTGYGTSASSRINLTIRNMKIITFFIGVYLFDSSNSTICGNSMRNCTTYGIELSSSSNNRILGNNITENKGYGVDLYDSDFNEMVGNTIKANRFEGINLLFSSHNTISENIVGGSSSDGIRLWNSLNNAISKNNVTSNTWHGINLLASNNTSIIGNSVSANSFDGVRLSSSSNNNITANIITNNNYGIRFSLSPNNTVAKNSIIANRRYGIYLESNHTHIIGNNITNQINGIGLYSCSYNDVSGNKIVENDYGLSLHYSSCNNVVENAFWSDGLYVFDSYSNLVGDNQVNGKPLVYLENAMSLTVADAGQVILVHCNNIHVENLSLSKTSVGLELWATNNSIIENNELTENNVYGVWLQSSWGNNIIQNNVAKNRLRGIAVESPSKYNTIIANNITESIEHGLYMSQSQFSNISKNIITNSNAAVFLYSCADTIISENDITRSTRGIGFSYSPDNRAYSNNISNSNLAVSLYHSANNHIYRNNIANNNQSMSIISSSNNRIYHNNFINHTYQIFVDSPNIWDNGYPSGGNYWSDYASEDLYNGPFQNNTGPDGIGDMPYSVGLGNVDRYPMMRPYSPLRVQIYTDKFTYHSGEIMKLGLYVINLAEQEKVCFAIWVVRPGGSIYLYTHMHNLTLSASFDYSNPAWQKITLPTLPSGIYTWHVALLAPAKHTIIIEDVAQWQLT